MQRLFPFWLGLLAAFVSGCNHSQSVSVVSDVPRDEIQSRVTNHFAHAVMFKPAEGGFDSALATQLAPLLIQATATTNAADRPSPTTSLLELSVQTNLVTIHTNHHAQFSYVWNQRRAGAAGRATPAQGVRITLDSRGAPVIWEVLHDSTGADVIYVAQSIEVLARAEFGAPPTGRKFAVERSRSDAETTVVANVIDDGPAAMGPILYLQSDEHDVSALICRCMPAQFQSLLGQQDYELLPATPGNQGEYRFSPRPLEQRLRLPSRF
jgi:hypothetical protein